MRTRVVATSFVLLLAGCTAVAVPPPRAGAPAPVPAPARACMDARTVELVRLTNAERSRRGLRVLEPDARLQQAAQGHAEDMARRDFMAHEGSDRSLPPERADRAGYHWHDVAENVAAGYADAATVHAGWMQSPGHRANILLPGVLHVGFGYAYRADTELHHYWVTVFGDTDDPRVPTPGCG